MTVYLVVSTAPYAGMEVHGCYDTREGADEEVARIIEQRGGPSDDEPVYVHYMDVKSSLATDEDEEDET